jgi:propionyl-CoA synthetase
VAGCQKAFDASMQDPEKFWGEAAKAIHWEKAPSKILTSNAEGTRYTWFEGGQTNAAYNALDRHVSAGRGNSRALIYDSPVTGAKKIYSYSELLSEVETAAGMLRNLGVKKGDKVAIYMPTVPQVTISVMACARIGAISTTIFGGFASHELALRLDDFQPKVILAG